MKANAFKKRAGGYSTEKAEQYIDPSKHVVVLTTEPDEKKKYDQDAQAYTDEIDSYRLWFVQEGTPPFEVKFDVEPPIVDFLSKVTFENLQACTVGYDVYFKADSIKAVK